MQIYLPIAALPVDIFLILAIGFIVGILAGMFGIGGGFLATPLLIFIGIPPTVAVSSSANQTIAASCSGFFVHWKKKNVDFKMAFYLFVGGIIGSSFGIYLFVLLQEIGQIDIVISILFIVFLGTIAMLMAIESAKAMFHKKNNILKSSNNSLSDKIASYNLPFKVYFERSGINISVIIPILIGFCASILVSLIGIGGGFIMVPAMIYLLGMPTSVVVGTSLLQIIFISANVTFLQAINTHTVDIILSTFLLTGSVLGAQLGSRLGSKLPAENLRFFLALLMLFLVSKLLYSLLVQPDSLYEITEIIKKNEL